MAVTQSLTLTESTIDGATNTSKVRILWKSTQTGDSWNGYTKTAKYYVSINGGTEKEYTASYTLPKNSTTTIVDAIITVDHKLDGSGTITVRTWMDTGISAGVVTKTASLTLTTIPRETTLDSLVLTGGSLNGTINVNYTPKNPSFYNKYIVYVNVNKQLTQIRTDALNPGTTQKTYPLTFNDDEKAKIYSKVTNSSSATIRVTIQTYDNTYKTKIGSDQSREITVALPTSVAPTAVLTVVPVNTNTWVASVRDNGEEIYVAGLSGATVILAASPGEGAQPDTASITYDGTTVNTTFNTTLNVKTLNKAGEIKFTAKVGDTRGRTATDEKTITVRPYSSPTVTSMNVERGKYNNDGSWETNATGGDVRVIFQTNLSLNNEGNVYTAAFKIDNKEPTQLVGTISGLKTGVERTVYFVGVDGDVSHTLKLTVTDKVGNVGAATITIPTTHITVEYKANGKGIAFGKTSEHDAFECAMDAEFIGATTLKGASTVNEDLNLKKNIHMGGLNGQTHEQVIRFSNPTSSTYPHNAYFYGGNPNSVNTIGCYDGQNNRLVWGYNDTNNTISIGNSANISINGKTMADFVVEQGASGTWTWRKWQSGRVEAWGTHSYNFASPTAVGALYSYMLSISFPSGLFSTAPTYGFVTSDAAVFAAYRSWESSATTGKLAIYSAAQYNSTSATNLKLYFTN